MTLKKFICSYNDNDTPPSESWVFECMAEDEAHAIEQCQNAYPSAFVAEGYLADDQPITNCLAGLKCPECENEASLRIEARIVCHVTDGGSEPTGRHQWDENSFCRCPECEFTGTVRDFTGAEAQQSESPDGLYAPWSLHFDRDGTEDVAVICDVDGTPIVTSRHFWLPEKRDPTPATMSAVRVMKAAPRLLAACQGILASFHESVTTKESLAEFPALKAVAEAIAEAIGRAA